MAINVQQSLAQVADLDTLNTMLDPLSMRAGWNKTEPSLWPNPRTSFQPASWSWAVAKAGLDSAGRLINTDKADRRNLFLVNPMEGNYYATLRTLVSAYQMIMPGERAKSHRHTPNALRLVLDVGEDVYTVVDGVRLDMSPGDVVLTPGWSWHGHGNDGNAKGYWIDFLDVPLVQLLEPMFLEHWPEGFQTPEQKTRQSPFVFGWSDTERGLAAAKPDQHGRTRIELGDPALPTIALHMEKVGGGASTRTMRTTSSQIVCVVSGEGSSKIGDREFQWSKGDAIAIPSWHPFSHKAKSEAVLFTVSDEAALKKLNLLHVESPPGSSNP